MPSIISDIEYERRRTPPAPKPAQPKWVPKYEPYNPFAPKAPSTPQQKQSRAETVAEVNAAREPWKPFQTVANIFEQALNNPYNPFSRTQTMIGPQNNPWAPFMVWGAPTPGMTSFTGMPIQSTRRASFGGTPTNTVGAWRNEQFFNIPNLSGPLYPKPQPKLGAWQNEQFFNIPDQSGPLYWTPQYINAPQHAPNYGGGWSSWGGGGGGGEGDRSSAAFYQGNYTQQRARWNETLLTWGLRQE